MTMIENRNKSREETDYIFRFASNTVLNHLFQDVVSDLVKVEKFEDLLEKRQKRWKTLTHYANFTFRTASSWTRSRMVTEKADIKPNPKNLFGADVDMRFIVSSFTLDDEYTTEDICTELYNLRGKSENWIKENKNDFDCRHASMGKLHENIVRMFFKFFAQVLIELCRSRLLKGTKLENKTAKTIREQFINLRTRVYNSHRRFHFSFAKSFLNQKAFDTACNRLPGLVEELVPAFKLPPC